VRALPAGTEIGKSYVIEAPISSGGMGAVYRARRLWDDTPVAIKHPLEERNALRFQIEARLLARLRHPRVVRVLDHVASEHGDVLVMELVRGPSLASLLSGQGPLPVGEAIEYARQACEALAYIHAQHIVHRDVKPANLILADEGIVLVDFGIARDARAVDRPTGALGTPRFAAPEVLAGAAASPRSDVYGLAATLWAMITGEPPSFLARGSLAARLPDVSRKLDGALAAALEPDPHLRLASAEEFARALGEGLRQDRGASLSLSVPRPSAARAVLETIVRTVAGVFGAAAASIAFLDGADLVYEAAWGAGASEVVGLRLPEGAGLSGAVVASGEGVAVPECRTDPRFSKAVAAKTGYVPHTMLVTPLIREGRTIGALSLLDRRDGQPYRHEDLARAALFADLAVVALDLDTFPLSTTGGRTRL
jgi:hypothetical protein